MSLRVSLRRADLGPGDGAEAAPRPLLEHGGAHVVLGRATVGAQRTSPISPSASALFAPRGVAVGGVDGPLVVSDTGHHRVLVWTRLPERDGAPADVVLGQGDFATEGRNRKADVGPGTLHVPAGVAAGSGVLAVADSWNHRVLLWFDIPSRNGAPADVVLGQPDLQSGLANRGRSVPAADTLSWCAGVTIVAGRLAVADTGNRRVLLWNRIPESHGAPADLVLGQADFSMRDEGGGGLGGVSGMRWPHAIAVLNEALFVADAGSSRVMHWGAIPSRNGENCQFVLGQRGLSELAHNRGAYNAAAASMNMPYGLAGLGGKLVVADTANSRLLGFDLHHLSMGAPAIALAGQRSFDARGENRWSDPSRDSLCWPYAVASYGSSLAIADTGNDRVLLWRAA